MLVRRMECNCTLNTPANDSQKINIFCLFKQNMQQSIRSWLPSWIHLWTKVFTNSFIILCLFVGMYIFKHDLTHNKAVAM